MWKAIVQKESGSPIIVREGEQELKEILQPVCLGLNNGTTDAWLPPGQKDYTHGYGASASFGGNTEIESEWASCKLPSGITLRLRLRDGQFQIEIN